MSTDTAKNSRFVRISGLVAIVAGAVMVIAGAVTWGAVASHLTAENITVSEDAAAFGGQTVNTPWEAYAQAEIINHHALEATGGKTYAELDKEDPLRAVAMNGSFLRASLFTSVVAFGVAALVVGVGLVFGLIGFALRKVAPAAEVVAPAVDENLVARV
ncbi:aromatic ring-opening dioxygenase LigA [Cellulomonas sp. P5_E12]